MLIKQNQKLTTKQFKLAVSLLLFLFITLFAQQSQNFSVVSIEGTASVQHSEQYQWIKVNAGDPVQSNDIFETDFQTKLQLSLNGNIVVLGSNTKALLDFKHKGGNDSIRTEISVTVFNGGVLTKSERGCKMRVFTTNAVAETDSATLSTVVDGKTGESGFQVISGNVNVRNITQSKGKILRSGLTTMVLPNKEPSAALYMTNRHVTVLKHFFGDEYIQLQLDQAGVKPTEEKVGNRLTMSKNYSSRSQAPVTDDMYKELFDIEKIYGSIIDDQLNRYAFYKEYRLSPNVTKKRMRFTLSTTQGAGNDQSFSAYALTAAYGYKFIDGALRFGLYEEKQSDRIGMNFTSAEGWLDKVEHVTLGHPADSLYITLGGIDGLTYGNGLIVDNFRNGNSGTIYHTAGLKAHASFKNEIALKGFLADILNPYVGGIHLGYEPSSYYVGLGYYFDLDQYYKTITNDNFKYAPPGFLDTLKPGHGKPEMHIGEISLGADLSLNYEFHARIFGEIASKFIDGKSEGRLIRIPSLYVDFYKSHLWVSLFLEKGKLTNGLLNEFYMDHRNYLYGDTALKNYTIESVTSLYSKDRRAMGFSLKYGVNPIKGIDVSLVYIQNILERNTFTDIVDSTETSFPLNYTYKLRLGINDSLIKFVKYAGVYLTQRNSTYFPQGGKLAISWQTEAGIDLQTNPLFYNIAIESRLRYFYLENSHTANNIVNKDDHIVEWYFGILWGFL